MKFKRVLALGLVASMAVGMLAVTGCNGAKKGNASYDSDGKRVIKIGTWWEHYYTSDHTSIFDDPSLTLESSGGDEEDFAEAQEYAQKRLDNTRKVEEKYNCKIQFVNLTFQGNIDSLNNSILAGKNDCDIYHVQMDFGVPAVAAGYAANLKDYLPEDHDLFTNQTVFTYIDLSQVKEGVYLFKPNDAEAALGGTYMLAYNQDMINAAGVEDPYTIWKNNPADWTWDKWMSIMKQLVKDTDGDGVTDQYGFDTHMGWGFPQLLMSNNATIAAGATQTLDDPKTLEVANFINDLYQEGVAHPYVAYVEEGEDYATQAYRYMNGKIAFWLDAAWISDQNKDVELPFEITWVPWPVGPSGDAKTSPRKTVGGGYDAYMIASCAEDPKFIFDVFYDWTNWYDFDTEYRDARLTWWHNSALSEQNYDVMLWCSNPCGFDMFPSVPTFKDETACPIARGEQTPAEWAETYKNMVQDYLDSVLKK